MTHASAINWFDIPAADFDRAKKFYESLYEISMQEWPAPDMRMAIFPAEPGKGIGGAVVQSEMHQPSQTGTIVYLNGGDDLSTILGRVEGAGGKIVVPKTAIGGDNGYLALFSDTEGNVVGLHSKN